jgi:hypothetical protein
MDCRTALLFSFAMHPQSRFTLFVILLLLLSSGNLYGVGLALWRRNSGSELVSDKWGTVAMLILACSQVMYLIFVFAWLFEWVRFFPGNPVQTAVIYCGFSLSAAALVTASCGLGLKRLMGIVVAFTTALLWLVAALGSVVA